MKPVFSEKHEEYIQKNKDSIVYYQETQGKSPFSGHAILEWTKFTCVSELFYAYPNTSSFLDYGCGPGVAYQPGKGMHELFGQIGFSNYTLYDPCFPDNDVFPEQTEFDGVVCIDVLEHIPDTDIRTVLDYLFNISQQWIYLHISTKKNSGSFPLKPGYFEYFHITLKTSREWENIIQEYSEAYPNKCVFLTTDYPGDEIGFDFNEYGGQQSNVFTVKSWNDTHDIHGKIQQLNQTRSAPSGYEVEWVYN